MSILRPLETRLASLARSETNKAVAIADSKKDIAAILKITGPMMDAAEVIIRGVVEINERAGMIDRRMGEIDPGETADKINDLRLILEHLKILNRLEYVKLATGLDVLDPELIPVTMRELAHLPTGPEKIAAIHQAISELKIAP